MSNIIVSYVTDDIPTLRLGNTLCYSPNPSLRDDVRVIQGGIILSHCNELYISLLPVVLGLQDFVEHVDCWDGSFEELVANIITHESIHMVLGNLLGWNISYLFDRACFYKEHIDGVFYQFDRLGVVLEKEVYLDEHRDCHR